MADDYADGEGPSVGEAGGFSLPEINPAEPDNAGLFLSRDDTGGYATD